MANVPGANCAASNACLAAETSSIWTSETALCARLARSSVNSPASSHHSGTPFHVCLATGSSNFFRGTKHPRGGLWKSMRGRRKNNFQPLVSLTLSLDSLAASSSWNATSNVVLKVPWRNLVTVLMTAALLSKISSGLMLCTISEMGSAGSSTVATSDPLGNAGLSNTRA